MIFDGGWRILSGQVPYKDFLMAFGPLTFVMQAVAFKLFGVNWTSMVIAGGFGRGRGPFGNANSQPVIWQTAHLASRFGRPAGGYGVPIHLRNAVLWNKWHSCSFYWEFRRFANHCTVRRVTAFFFVGLAGVLSVLCSWVSRMWSVRSGPVRILGGRPGTAASLGLPEVIRLVSDRSRRSRRSLRYLARHVFGSAPICSPRPGSSRAGWSRPYTAKSSGLPAVPAVLHSGDYAMVLCSRSRRRLSDCLSLLLESGHSGEALADSWSANSLTLTAACPFLHSLFAFTVLNQPYNTIFSQASFFVWGLACWD